MLAAEMAQADQEPAETAAAELQTAELAQII
jgi:hypothetical protein